jgi:amino acid adenylation domain-containing protein
MPSEFQLECDQEEIAQFPATSNQLNFWLQEKLNPGHPALVMVVHWKAFPNTSEMVSRIHQTFEELVGRHQLLRTTFPHFEGVPTGRIGPSNLDFKEHDLVGDDSAEKALNVEKERPWDLENETPLRVRVYRGADSKPLHLFVLFHHIAVDWYSLLILFSEFRLLMAGNSLLKPKLDFATLAKREEKWLLSEQARLHLRAWKEELASPCPDFRIRPERPGLDPRKWGRVHFSVGAGLTEGLRKLAADNECPLLAVLLTSYGRVLSRHTGRREVFIAAPCTTRTRREEDGVVGPLFNLMPIRLSLNGSFRRCLAQAGKKLNRALEMDQFPFWGLVEEMRPRSAQGRPPFTDAALSLLPSWENWERSETPGMVFEEVHQDFLVGPFGATLSMVENEGGLSGCLQYDMSLLGDETARQWSDEMLENLESCLLDPGARVGLPQNRHHRMEAWFSAQAAATPDRPAIIQNSKVITFKELEHWSSRLAAAIPEEFGGRPVGVFASPSAESVVGWLAVLKRAGICLPLDPLLPPERLRLMGQDCDCRLVLTTRKWNNSLPFGEAILIDGDLPQPWKGPVHSATQEDRAYLIYTSGSQGQPQGVLGRHRGAIHRAEWIAQAFPWEEQERCLLRTPPGFVDAVTEWFAPLVGGAALVPYGDGRLLDPNELMLFLHWAGVTRLTTVPGLLQLLLHSPHHWPGRLHCCISSGEVLRPDLVERFRRRAGPGPTLLNLYGSTECAGDATWCDTRYLEKGATTVPLGAPLGQTDVYILDPELRKVPEGEEGDIWVGGPGLCLGYWNRETLEQERFLANPFGSGRLFQTGDRGCWRRGQLEFRGRTDRQAKVQGWRVELGEIEACLEATPGVREATAVFEDGRIRAWIVGDKEFSAQRLWSHIRRGLPSPMQPTEVRRLARLPRLASQKVDRCRLAGGSPVPRVRSAEPVDPCWAHMAELWKEALDLDQVGAHDNFFELGGRSLQAVYLMDLIQQKFDQRLSASVLLEAPTVATLSEKVQTPPLPEILISMKSDGTEPPLFLLPGAWGGVLSHMELIERLSPNQPVHFLNFEGVTQEDKLSLQRLADRFVAEIRRLHPVGPYRLMGFSMGGLVAYEMALRLGHQLERLVLLDTRGPRFQPKPGNLLIHRISLALHLFLIVIWSPPRLTLKRIWRRIIGQVPQMTQSERYDLGARYIHNFEPPEPPFPGPVTLIKMTHQPHYVQQTLLGWEGLFSDLSVRRLVGVHSGLVLEIPLVDRLALALTEVLRK